jgi:hypothetical protein
LSSATMAANVLWDQEGRVGGWDAQKDGRPTFCQAGAPRGEKTYGCAECKQNARSGGFCHRLLDSAKKPVEVKHEHELLLTQARHGAHEVRTTP